MKPQTLFYVLLGLIGLLIIGGGAGFYLGHDQLADKIDDIQRLRAEAAVTQEEAERLAELEHDYTSASDVENKATQILPEEKQQTEVTAQIFAMIDEAGLENDGISFQSTDGVPGRTTQTDSGALDDVLVMPANFTITGTYRQLLIFLDSVEQQERLMQVTSLDINRSSESDQLTLRVQMEVFIKS